MKGSIRNTEFTLLTILFSQSCMRYIKRIFAAASASMSPASP